MPEQEPVLSPAFAPVTGFHWHARLGQLVTGGLDGIVRRRDGASGEPLRRFPAGAGEIRDVALSPKVDGVAVAAGTGRSHRVVVLRADGTAPDEMKPR